MGLRAIIVEGLVAARASMSFTIANTIAICLATFATSLTVGQTASAEADLAAELRSPRARLVALAAERAPLQVPLTTLLALGRRTDVAAVLALGTAVDVQNQAAPTVSSFTTVRDAYAVGRVDELVRCTRVVSGMASAAPSVASRLEDGVGGLLMPSRRAVPIVGRCDAATALEGRLTATLRWVEDETTVFMLRSLFVLGRSVEDSVTISRTITRALGVDDPRLVAVESPRALDDVRAAVEGRFGRFSRSLIYAAVSIASAWVALTTSMWALARTRDFARRRVLGATRLTLFWLILVQVLVAVICGALFGQILYALVSLLGWTKLNPISFVAAIEVLLVAGAALGATVPAAFAVTRDPVRAVRVA